MTPRIVVASTLSLVAACSLVGIAPSAHGQAFWQQLPGLTDIDGRQDQIEKRIAEAVKSGRLKAADAAAYRSELKQIADTEASYRADGKLSIWETLRLTMQLDQLSKSIETHLQERTVALTDVDGRQAEIEKEIAEALSSGRLTAKEAADFRAESKRIADREAQYRADGDLSSSELLALSVDLDHLASDIETQLRERAIVDPNIDAMQAEIEKRISDLAAAGKISPAEVSNLRQEFDRIAAREAAFQGNDGRIGPQEKLTLALDLERLSQRIDRLVPSAAEPVLTIDDRQAAIEKQLDEAVSAGKIRPRRAAELRREFDRIASLEATFRADGRMSDAETLTLARDLDLLGEQIERSLSRGSVAGIEERQSELKARIDEAVASGRLSPDEAAEIRRRFDRISAKERLFRLDGSLDESETLTLAADLDKLTSAFDSALAPLPDIGSRRQKFIERMQRSRASRRLPPQAEDRLRQELERIARLESSYESSQGRLDDTEIMSLAQEFDVVDRLLEKSLVSLPDITTRKAEVEKKLKDGKGSGRLSAEAAAALQDEFDRITDLEKQARASEGELSDSEVLTLKDDLDRLDKSIERSLSTLPVAVVPKDVVAPPDVRGHWAEPYIAMLSSRGIIGGFPDGTFRPTENITRAQFAAIAVKALNLPASSSTGKFKDVPANHWAASAIAAASDAGLVTGFPDNTFRPADNITRAQALVILSKALKDARVNMDALDRYADAGSVPPWAVPSVSRAADAGIIVNYPDAAKIEPNELATRAEVAALTYQTMSKNGNDLPPLRIGLLEKKSQ